MSRPLGAAAGSGGIFRRDHSDGRGSVKLQNWLFGWIARLLLDSRLRGNDERGAGNDGVWAGMTKEGSNFEVRVGMATEGLMSRG